MEKLQMSNQNAQGQIPEAAAMGTSSGTNNKAVTSAMLGKPNDNPLYKAMAVVKADEAHRSLAGDQILMFRAAMPAWKAQMKQLSSGLFQWFRHQGFWREDHSNYGNIQGNRDGTVTISTDEYIRLKKAEKIALIHSELSEMLEGVRKNTNEAEEWADTLVRLIDYNGGFNVGGEEAFESKMYENYQRPFKHNKEF